MELSESLVHEEGAEASGSEHLQHASGRGKVAALKRYLRWGASVAKPVVGYVPIVGGVLKRTIEHIVPTPGPTTLPQEQPGQPSGASDEVGEAAAAKESAVQQEQGGPEEPMAATAGPPTN